MTVATPLTEPAVREPLRAHLRARVTATEAGLAGKPSAVLVPLFLREGTVHLWLVRRAANLRSHSGQVAFPGGKRDDHDPSLLHTALREAHEEVGIAPSRVDVLGALDAFPTITGYVITPFVGWVEGDEAPVPNPAEVARVFAAPLHHFLVPDAPPAGVLGRFGYAVEGEWVWGATAAVLRNLVACLRAARTG